MMFNNIPYGLKNSNVSVNLGDNEFTYKYLTAVRVLWKSEGVRNENVLLRNDIPTQVSFDEKREKCIIKTGETPEGILLDFGVEIHGFVQLFIKQIENNHKIRVRFGESAMEAMAEPGFKNAGNDHIRRDNTYDAGFLSMPMFGPSGFRFVRIDLVEPNSVMVLETVKAICTYRDIPYIGSFECNDELLNTIWKTCAYTVHLNMQEFLWDGIKRDRLVWIGDMHPEASVIKAVFGNNECVPKSLDLARDTAPLPAFMNNIPAYSMWWIMIHYNWYLHYADYDYLVQQRDYMIGLADMLCDLVDENGSETINNKFIDWPSNGNADAMHEGVQALLYMSLVRATYLLEILEAKDIAYKCTMVTQMMRTYKFSRLCGYKQSAALLSMAGSVDPKLADKTIELNGAEGLSTFLGYYTLKAQAIAGNMNGALRNIRTFWGAMLERGATTFWEDFNMQWLNGSGRIDELVPDGVKDLHGDYGAFCYEGYRHSLCHGWSAGPAAFMATEVLGVKPTAPGFSIYEIKPQLGDLEWVKGTYPTKEGYIEVSHEKSKSGKIVTTAKRY